MDGGLLTSSFSKLTTYVYATHLFTFTVDRVANSMTKGLNYRFMFSRNAIGYSDFSDSSRVGLGPLPSQPTPSPQRDVVGNSPTSIGLKWNELVGETLEVLEYRLYMDDGNGVIFNMIYKGIDLNHIATNLTSGIGYSFKVSAVNFNGEGQQSSPPSVIKSCIVPSGVQAPQLIGSTSTTVTLRWTQPLSNGGCPIQSYAIFRDDGANGDFVTNMDAA